MNALPWAPRDAGALSDGPVQTRERVAQGTCLWMMVALLAAFWVYVAMSNVLYANSMQASFATVTGKRVFATWDVRLLQHLFLFPIFVSCVFASVRLGWNTLWKKLPPQLLLGVFFAALASPILGISEYILAAMQTMY